MKIAIAVALLVAAGPAMAQSIYDSRPNSGSIYESRPNPGSAYGYGSNPSSHGVQGYTTPQGTYVQPHQQTNPNTTQMDNYGSRGNVNPYNGSMGTRTPRW